MTPYYEHAGITIYHGDCRDVLPMLTADVVVTDPPFGISDSPNTHVDTMDVRRGQRSGHVNTWHPPSAWDTQLDPSWLPVALSVCPVVVLFGHWRKRTAFQVVAGMEPRAEIVWAKNMHTAAPCPVAPRDERIWVFSHGAIVPTRFETSVWDEPVIPTWDYKDHKNEKPLRLMRRLVSWLNGQIVLDPFAGSGSTLVAAKAEGRHAIGIEIDERYCEIAARRLSQDMLPFEMADVSEEGWQRPLYDTAHAR